MTSGGYRRPSAPAPVSGPGAQSKRTDGGPAQKLRDLPDAQYGENATYRDLQVQAPLAQTPASRPPTGPSGGKGSAPSTAFDAPTARPDEPVQTGLGLGASGVDLGQQLSQQDLDRLKRYLPALMEMASRDDATPSFRNYVRTLRAKVG